jgi:thiamine pyrophosphokinase
MAQNELRQRKTTNKKKKTSKENKAKSKTDVARALEAAPDVPETLWETFIGHPLIVVAPYIVIPYLVMTSFFFFSLRRPDILKGLVSLRPAVPMNERRQVLILGAIGSGTQQITESLSKIMKLEIAHENTNTLQVSYEQFVREQTPRTAK